MKKYLLFIAISFWSLMLTAQYNLPANNGDTIYSSIGTFFLGTYDTGEIYEITICSDDIICSHINLNFLTYVIDSANFCIYDGQSTSEPLIACNSWGMSQTVEASSSNPSGCLTIQFEANTTASDIIATIGCQFQCQAFYANVITDPVFENEPSIGYVLYTCDNIGVDFSATGIYPGLTYSQSDASSSFSWLYDENPVGTGQNFSFNFNENGAHLLQLIVTDTLGCTNTGDIKFFVIKGFDGIVSFSPYIFSTFQLGDTIPLQALVYEEPEVDCSIPTIIPDGSGVSYELAHTIAEFAPGQILENVEDLRGICATIEHSFLGDLVIEITCPFNTLTGGPSTVVLESQDGGGTYLGVPVDDFGGGEPGIGWEYCWTIPSYADFLGDMGTIADSCSTLPSGSYLSSEPLNALVGCELNGEWTLTITDNWSVDDGYIFCWDIEFDDNLYLIPSVLNSNYDTSYWLGPEIVFSNETFAQALPNEPGTYTYTYSLIDSSGCNTEYYLTYFVIEEASVISGQVYRDGNNNCSFDIYDYPYNERLVEINPGPYYATTDSEGNYTAYLNEGEYEVSLITWPTDIIDCPVDNVYNIMAVTEDTISGLDFANNSPVIVDLSVLGYASMAVNWMNFYESFHIRNTGEITLSNINFELKKEPWQIFLYSSATPIINNDTLIVWNFSNLSSGAIVNLSVDFDITSSSVGDIIINSGTVSCNETETNLSNNSYTINRTVATSYDPNCKTVYPKGETAAGNITLNDSLLTYTVFFQNTGTYYAQNVVILDSISPYLDISTFRPLGASHPYTWDISGTGLLKFSFPEIMLPDSTTNEPESHGSVSYEIKLKESADVGDVIANTAYIYFDYNEPVITNTTLNTIVDFPVILNEIDPQQINLYPNPASSVLNILPENDYNYVIYNLLGEKVMEGKGKTLIISNLQNGAYVIEIKNVELNIKKVFLKTTK